MLVQKKNFIARTKFISCGFLKFHLLLLLSFVTKTNFSLNYLNCIFILSTQKGSPILSAWLRDFYLIIDTKKMFKRNNEDAGGIKQAPWLFCRYNDKGTYVFRKTKVLQRPLLSFQRMLVP